MKKCDYFLKMLLLYLLVPTNLSTIVGENTLILPRMRSFKVVLVLIRPLDCINEFQ